MTSGEEQEVVRNLSFDLRKDSDTPGFLVPFISLIWERGGHKMMGLGFSKLINAIS